jgi:hypothetical protein
MAFCDPHYMLMNGTAMTCNQLGWNVLARARNGLWNVSVEHQSIGGSLRATKIAAVRVDMYFMDDSGSGGSQYQFQYSLSTPWQNQVATIPMLLCYAMLCYTASVLR